MAVQVVEASLSGVPLLRLRPIVWSLKAGVDPVIRTFDIDSRDIDRLTGLDSVSLRIRLAGDVNRGFTFRQLSILDMPPGPRPNMRTVRVADRRWVWRYKHIVRSFNIRRKVGVRRAEAPNEELEGQPGILDEIRYAPFSLNQGKRWTAVEALDSIATEVSTFEGSHLQPSPGFILPQGQGFRQLPLEDIDIDDRADTAIARMLEYLPGVGVFIDLLGRAIFYKTSDQSEAGVVAAMTRKIDDIGFPVFVDKQSTRPRCVNVLFDYEVETRLDYFEQSEASRGGTTLRITEKQKEERLLLENVISLPDFSLLIQGNREHQGTWVEFADLLLAWGNPPSQSSPINLSDLRKGILPNVDLLAAFVPPTDEATTQIWTARIGALMQHWRRTFRISQRLMGRTVSVRAYRLVTVDSVTGARAPAIAYADYSVMRAKTPIFTETSVRGLEEAFFAMSVRGYPQTGAVWDDLGFGLRNIDPGSKPMPVDVSVVDQEQGIIQLSYQQGPARMFSLWFPGEIDPAFTPRVSRLEFGGVAGVPISFDTIISGGRIPELASPWRLAVILTIVPANLNETRPGVALHRIRVEPGDVNGLLARPVGAANGPPMDVRIPASLETARVRWSDTNRERILQLLGILPVSDVQGDIDFSDLISNRSHNLAGASALPGGLDSVARAAAARVYASFADRWQGNVGTLLQAFNPTGSIQEITFEVAPNGVATVQAHLPEERPEMSLFGFLDAGTRRIILHLVQGPAA